MSESARHQKYYFHRTKSIGVRGSTVFVEPESSPATEVLFSSSEMLGDARSTQIVLLLSTKRLLFFARQNKYFLRFADSRRCGLRRSDGATPTRLNWILFDKNNTSSARAIHEKTFGTAHVMVSALGSLQLSLRRSRKYYIYRAKCTKALKPLYS